MAAYYRWRSTKCRSDNFTTGQSYSEYSKPELLAIGIRESAEPYKGPEIIPSDLFESYLESVQLLFSNPARLVLAGRSWVQVTVTERQYAPKKPKRNQRTTKLPDQGVAAPPPSPQAKRGRPTVGAQLDKIVGKLKLSGELSEISRKEQESRVRESARLHHPDDFKGKTSPSRPKILEALKRAGYGRSESTKSP